MKPSPTVLDSQRSEGATKKGTASDDAVAIRRVMNEVEQIARFEAPRGLSCYCDVLRQHLREIGRDDLLDQLEKSTCVHYDYGTNDPR